MLRRARLSHEPRKGGQVCVLGLQGKLLSLGASPVAGEVRGHLHLKQRVSPSQPRWTPQGRLKIFVIKSNGKSKGF